MPRLHVSLRFAELPDAELLTFTDGVDTGLEGNAAYPTLPTTAPLTDLLAAKDALGVAIPKAKQGGPMDTAHKNSMQSNLIALLYILANYVEGACNQDLETLLSSGFLAANQERRREALVKLESVTVKSGAMEGQIVAAVKPPVKNCSLYEGRAMAEGSTTWLPSAFTSDSRHIIFNNLTPGTLYSIEICAHGGLTGASEWSDAVSHRAP
jgi:hypothetical protein